MAQLSNVTGIADLRIQQPFNQPKIHIDVDRTKALQTGSTQKDVAGNLLVSLSGSFQTTPSFCGSIRNRKSATASRHRLLNTILDNRFKTSKTFP